MQRLSTASADFAAAFRRLLDQARDTTERVDAAVAEIIAEVCAHGDGAVCAYTARFDRLSLTPAELRITPAEIDAAVAGIDPALIAALTLAATRIEAFHRAQMPADFSYTDDAGLTLGLRWTALDAVGLYVPGGRAAYPSSVLMNAIPRPRRRRRPGRHGRPLPWRLACPTGAGRGQACRCGRDLPHRRRAGGGGAGVRHRDDPAG